VLAGKPGRPRGRCPLAALMMTGAAIAGSLKLTPSAICKLAQKGCDDPLSKEIEDLVLAGH